MKVIEDHEDIMMKFESLFKVAIGFNLSSCLIQISTLSSSNKAESADKSELYSPTDCKTKVVLPGLQVNYQQ